MRPLVALACRITIAVAEQILAAVEPHRCPDWQAWESELAEEGISDD
jgi:hypothetical protein